MYNVLIVDDEKNSRDFVRTLVLEVLPDAQVAEARSAKEARDVLDRDEVDFLFSDIRMPHEDGFDLLNSLHERSFMLVFVTAYKEYAIQAIKQGAADYILKPINADEFKETFAGLVHKRQETLEQRFIAAPDTNTASPRLILSHQKGVMYLPLNDIIYMEASNVYTIIYFTNRDKVISSKPIHRFEELLSGRGFFRIHKSYLVNISHFQEYISKGSQALMSNGGLLQISKFKLGPFLQLVEDTAGRLKA